MSRGRSLIAGANAMFRMAESASHRTRILSDPWAHLFVEHHPTIAAVRFGRFTLPWMHRRVEELRTAHCVRHAAVDALVLQAVRRGAEQLVVVGAGYDMRPARFAKPLAHVRCIEIDAAPTAARKRACLARANLPGQAEYAEANLLTDSLLPALLRTGFRSDRPTCFVLEGLVHYLSADCLDRVLAEMTQGAAPRSVILSFIETQVYRSAPAWLARTTQLLQEVPRLHFRTEALARRLAAAGLPSFRAWNFEQQLACFVPQAAGRRVGASQHVACAERHFPSA